MSRSVPPGWQETTLGEIAEIQGGITKGKNRTVGVKLREVAYLRVANVQRGYLDLATIKTIPATEDEAAAFRLIPGDVLFNEGGDRDKLGRGWIWNGEIAECIHQNHVFRARLYRGLLIPELLSWYGNSEGQSYFVREGKQTTNLASLNSTKLRGLPVLIPPGREQREIVDAIESYFSRLDDAVATLGRVERNLKRYRASVLKAAVEGRLVPTEAALAKQEGRDYEPASVLLERILDERRRRWSESGKKSKYQEPMPPDPTTLPPLPEGWCWTSIESLIWDADYGTSQKCTSDATGPAVLRIPNVQEQSLRLDDLKFATDPKALSADGAVKAGDLVFIRTNGSRNLIGRGAVLLDDLPKPHHFASYLIRMRVLQVGGLPRWVGLAWHSPILREQILTEAASSAGQYNVGMKAAIRFVVPLAPAAEQTRILDESERLDTLAEATIATASAATERSTRLRQAIVKWAFEGKLADQDPSDEPASVLLERIKAERAAAEPVKAARPSKAVAKKKVRA